jgi:hypothetical protein
MGHFNMQFVVAVLLREAFLGFPLIGKLAAQQTDEVVMLSLILHFLRLLRTVLRTFLALIKGGKKQLKEKT